MKRLKFYLKYKLRRSESLTSLKSVLYFIVMMGAIFGVQYVNSLFLPWSMLGIYIFIFLVLFKIIGASKDMFFPGILITSAVFLLFVLPYTTALGTHGLESYIEHKYTLKPYHVIKCDYSGGYRIKRPDKCVVPGYPEAEKEVNLIIKVIDFFTFYPIIISIVVMSVKELKEKRKRNLNNQSN